jgi:hypothetical protein
MIVYNLFLYSLWSDAQNHTPSLSNTSLNPLTFFLHSTVQHHKYSHTVNCKVSNIASQEENRHWYKYISYMVYNLKRHHTVVRKWIFKCCEEFRKNKWYENTIIWTLYTATREQYYYSYTALSRTWIPTEVKVHIIKISITYSGTWAVT